MGESSPLLPGDVVPADIGTFASICIVLNQAVGPGAATLPATLQQAGWAVVTPLLLLAGVLSAAVAAFTDAALKAVPGNAQGKRRLEFVSLFGFAFGPRSWPARLSGAAFIVCVFSLILSSIVVSAQVMDYALLHLADVTCGLQVHPHVELVCVHGSDVAAAGIRTLSPFGAHRSVISAGLGIVALVSVPLGLVNLDENVWVQIGSAIFMWLITAFWLVYLGMTRGFELARLPALGDATENAVSTAFFNFVYVMTLPTWINEKASTVSVRTTIVWTTVLSLVYYLVLGVAGATAFDFTGNMDILSAIDTERTRHKGAVHELALATTYAWPVVVLISGIPVFMIIARKNLQRAHLLGARASAIVSTVLPWLLAVPFLAGKGLQELINWTSIFGLIYINFVAPLLCYHTITRMTDEELAAADQRFVEESATDEDNEVRPSLLYDTSLPMPERWTCGCTPSPGTIRYCVYALIFLGVAVNIACGVNVIRDMY